MGTWKRFKTIRDGKGRQILWEDRYMVEMGRLDKRTNVWAVEEIFVLNNPEVEEE